MATTGISILAATAALAAAIFVNYPAQTSAPAPAAAPVGKIQNRMSETPAINTAPAHRTLVSTVRNPGTKPGCAAQVWPNISRECLTVQGSIEVKKPARTIVVADSVVPGVPVATEALRR